MLKRGSVYTPQKIQHCTEGDFDSRRRRVGGRSSLERMLGIETKVRQPSIDANRVFCTALARLAHASA